MCDGKLLHVIELDHVVYVVANLEEAVWEIERTYGIVSLPGGTHPGGTANRVVPLRGSQYLEFLTVVDQEAAAEDEISRAVLSRMERGGGFGWWGLRTDLIEVLAARAGVELQPPLSIRDPDGTIRDLGPALIAPDDHDGALPFYCQYAEDLADRAAVWDERYEGASHPSGVSRFAWVEVAVDEPLYRAWVDEPSIPIRFVSGVDGIKGLGLVTADGEIAIRGDSPHTSLGIPL